MHLTSNPVDWYAARAAGLAAYVLLSAVVVLGLTMAGRARLARWPRFAVEEVHRAGGLLVGCFVVVHVVTIAIDSYLPFPLASLVVPGLSTYRPLWVALGIVAAELLLALAFTNRYRNRLVPYAFWRRAHYLNFAVWLAATLHGLGSGTDRDAPWLLAIYTGIMVTGVGGGSQRVWVRADILVELNKGLRGSAFQMEYLPSGLRCRGRVTHLEEFGFRAHCRTRTGLRRVVDVRWKPSDSPELKGGVIASRSEAPRVR